MADNSKIREEVQALTERLETGIQDLYASNKYAAYLDTLAHFHNYSTRNTMLIHLQMPEATQVAGFSKWKNEFERYVMKGQKGIRIFAPSPYKIRKEMEKLDPDTQAPLLDRDGRPVTEEVDITIPSFKAISVFDVSQTDGKPLPSLVENLTGDVQQYDAFLDALRDVSVIPIGFEALNPDTDGECRLEGRTIAIREGMSEVQTVSAVLHEMTHAELHDYNAELEQQESDVDAAGLEDSENADAAPKPRNRRAEEVEAESVSYVVCQHYGIETGDNSFGYVAEWSKDKELAELKASLDIIRKTAASMIERIDSRFSEICKERGIDLSPVQEEQEPTLDAPAPKNAVIAPEPEQPAPTATQRKYYITDRQREQAERMAAKWEARAEAFYAGGDGWGVDTADYCKTPEEADQAQERAEKINIAINSLVSGGGTWADVQMIQSAVSERDGLDAAIESNRDAPEPEVTPPMKPAIPDYNTFFVEAQTVGTNVLMPPVFDDGSFNRTGKRIRVTVEEPAGKYQLYSRNQGGDTSLYFLTASGMIDQTQGYFRDEWNEETSKWENHRPSEDELDEIIPLIAEQYERDLTNPTQWARYQHAAVLNRLDECDKHNAPVRVLRENEDEQRKALAEQERQAELLEQQVKYDGRIDEIAKAIENGDTISVGYDEYLFDGKNPVLDLFKLYDIKLPLRTQGWVNTGLAEISGNGYRYYSSRHKGNSSVFNDYFLELREAIKAKPIEAMRGIEQEAIKQEADVLATQDTPVFNTPARDVEPATDIATTVPNEQEITPDILPDKSIGFSERDLYGYTASDMLPLTRERAIELFNTDHTIYMLYPDNTEVMAFDSDEIITFGSEGIFGITKADWELSPLYAEQINAANDVTNEPDTIEKANMSYAIYQLKDSEATRDYRWEALENLETRGLSVDRDNYNLVYSAPLADSTTLDGIYRQFNTDHPADFTGHSLSMSDIIVLQQDGANTAHYIDRTEIVELPDFFREKQPEPAATEVERWENDHIADISVSTPPIVQPEYTGPSVAELKEQVDVGEQISLLDLARASHNEKPAQTTRRKGEKPSILAQLREAKKEAAQGQGQQKSAPKRDSEREV